MLTDEAKAILTFAARRYAFAGRRAGDIRVELGLSETRYCQVLDALLDDPEALAWMPVEVNRMRRLRDERRAVRTMRVRLQL